MSETKKISHSLVFLKASVIAMGIVFLVMLVALIIVKQKKSTTQNMEQNMAKNDGCQKFLQLKIAGEVDKMELQGNNIIILTKPNNQTKTQEIIKIDSHCTSVINHIELTQ
jgi:hypothetical protein